MALPTFPRRTKSHLTLDKQLENSRRRLPFRAILFDQLRKREFLLELQKVQQTLQEGQGWQKEYEPFVLGQQQINQLQSELPSSHFDSKIQQLQHGVKYPLCRSNCLQLPSTQLSSLSISKGFRGDFVIKAPQKLPKINLNSKKKAPKLQNSKLKGKIPSEVGISIYPALYRPRIKSDRFHLKLE